MAGGVDRVLIWIKFYIAVSPIFKLITCKITLISFLLKF